MPAIGVRQRDGFQLSSVGAVSPPPPSGTGSTSAHARSRTVRDRPSIRSLKQLPAVARAARGSHSG